MAYSRDDIDRVRERATGQEVLKSLSPGQTLVKVVNDELVHVMGEANDAINLNVQPPAVILMAGLQGSGKTTSSAKLARMLMEHERKKVMFMNADAVVVMPGGAGSLDEFFEALTWRQLGLHAKPIILLNTNGFWDPLRGLLDHVVASGFAEDTILSYVTTVPDVPTLETALQAALA